MDYLKGKIPTLIDGDNIFIKKIDTFEAKSLYNMLNNSDILRFMKISPPISIKEEEKLIKIAHKKWQKYKEFTFTIYIKKDSMIQKKILVETTKTFKKIKGTICGVVSLWNINYIDKFGEIGIWIGKDYWQLGINYETIDLMKKLAFKIIRLNRLEAKMDIDNIKSSKTFEKCGFTDEGILRKKINIRGVYRDIKIYSILRNEYEKSLE